ncbi:membrane fusion protein family auxiliary transport protein [Novosphingobium sp. Rr 2-17]|uniref:HlyD family secretion protein n=1 Tax=Novosphingobium sp. Rr 2-17 TaxID=555793 RepID=UPI000269A47C|nr:HlyD family secretion protein [Novosphingobium sp. Rr 2-17]EIZ81305.1 membrane fusion protein family auxiliary transport protein [Novosphingobium sp. Rr 2-17]
MTDTAVQTLPLTTPMRRPTRRQLLIGGGGLALIVLLMFGLHWLTVGRYMVGTDNAYVRADVVTITPRVAGYVAEVLVADNQRVRAGDVLARIDDRDYSVKVVQAEGIVAAAQAEVAVREARIANLGAQSHQQRSLITGNVAGVTASEADARHAGLEYSRQVLLTRQEVTSAQNLETAEADAKKASAGLAVARASLAAQRDRLPVLATERQAAVADLDKARAALVQAQAALTLARNALGYTVLRAPTAGVVGQRSLRVGQYAEVGTPLLAIVPDDAYVIANYKETQVGPVHRGQPADIEVDAFGGLVLNGHVESFAPASGAQFALLPPDNATGNFTKIVQRMPVRIRVDPGQARAAELRPGMSVVTTIDTRGAAR